MESLLPQLPAGLQLNDLFLFLTFARVAFSDNSTTEFQTNYDPATNTIELIIPDKLLPFLNQITGIQRGPHFKQFINWLIGQVSGGGGLVASSLVIAGTLANILPITLSSIAIPAGPLITSGSGVRLRAWGTTGANSSKKTISLLFGSTTVAINDVDQTPNGQNWELNAVVFERSSNSQEAEGSGKIGPILQSVQVSQPSEDETQNIAVTVVGQNSQPTANDIVCRGLFAEAI
jgi:hypothetical protein